MIVHKPAIIKFDKHVAHDIIPAASNPNADSDILKYRKYGLVDGYKINVPEFIFIKKAKEICV